MHDQSSTLTVSCSQDENNTSIFDVSSSRRTYLVGLCTGMLPAAALAVSNSTSQLLKISPEIVRLSLRVGIKASRRSMQIEQCSDSWAIAIPGMTPQEQQVTLDQFHAEHVRSPNPLPHFYYKPNESFT